MREGTAGLVRQRGAIVLRTSRFSKRAAETYGLLGGRGPVGGERGGGNPASIDSADA